MIRTALMFIVAAGSIPALASVQFQSFLWKADNAINVRFMLNQNSILAKGELRDGESRELVADTVTLTIKSYSNSFVAISFVEAGDATGRVMLLERQNGQYVPLVELIPARASTLNADLEGSIAALKKTNRWDHSIAIRSMVSFFAVNPTKTLSEFYDAVELGHIKTIAQPVPRSELKKEPKIRSKVDNPWPATIEREPPAQTNLPSTWETRTKKSETQVRPYDPRNGSNMRDYPGQNMRGGSARKPKNLFDLLFGQP